MILTMIGLVIFVVAGGILAFLAINSQAKVGISGIRTQGDEPFGVFSVALAFDPDYAIIWDTQVPVLQLIDRAAGRGIRAQQLRAFYSQSARRYPELYDGSSFGGWLEFLKNEQLIATIGMRVFITAEGHDFLAYRVVPETVLAA